MPDTPTPKSDDIAPLLRLGLEDDADSAAMTADVTMRVDAPTPHSGAPSQSRSWDPPSVDQLQQMLPHYDVTNFIARGGMGAVYKGVQRALKRPVAIKVLPPDLREVDLQFAERFKHEAQAMARLTHPNIVAVYDAGETADGLLYFVMEFIEGTDLAQIIASGGRLEPARAVPIITAVCEALAFAHEEGIVHRDIKPSNIMIDRRGKVKVADFGLAKSVNLDASLVTSSSVAMGTPDFIAPEVFIPGLKVDGRADLYAVGVMLYQMLTGAIPRGRFLLPSGIAPQVDKRFDDIVDKAMQNDREQRYSTAIEIKRDLEAVATPAEPRLTDQRIATPRPASAIKGHALRKALYLAAGLVVWVAGWFVIQPPGKTNEPASSPAAELPKEWIDGTQALREAGIQAGKLKEEGGWLSATQEDFYFKLNQGLESEDMAVRLVFDGSIGSHLRKQFSMRHLTGYVGEVVGREAKIVAKQIGRPDRLTVVNLPPIPPGQKEQEMIFVVRGNVMSQWVGGKLVNTISDEQHKRGWMEIRISTATNQLPGTRLRKVEYAIWPLSSPDKMDVLSSTATELPREWIDGTPALREAGIKAGKLREDNGWLSATQGTYFFQLDSGREREDFAVRVIFSDLIGLKLRKQNEAARFAGYMAEVGRTQAKIIAGQDNRAERRSVVELPRPQEQQEREMIFVVRGDAMSQWVDGKLVNTFKDGTYQRGTMELGIFSASNDASPRTRLRKVEYAILK